MELVSEREREKERDREIAREVGRYTRATLGKINHPLRRKTDHRHCMVPRHRAGLAEVGNAWLKILRQQDVLTLDVAVQDWHWLPGMEIRQAVASTSEDLDHYFERGRIGRILGKHKRSQRAAANKVHHNEEIGLEAVTDKGDQVDVVDLRKRDDLLGKGLESGFIDQA